MRTAVLVYAVLAAFAVQVRANGRPANTSTINFRQGDETHIAAGMTFGLLLSSDGGSTWQWLCEAAVRYGGMYDPDYAYSSSGALFATTFDAFVANRDGCVFETTPHAGKFMSTISLGPDGALYTAAVHPANPAISDPGDSSIYKSTDNGLTFPVSAAPGMVGDWWSSIEVAPTDPNRLYLSGYRLVAGGGRTFHLFKSVDGAASWTAISTTGLVTSVNSTVEIAGVSKLNPNHVFLRVTYQNEALPGDTIYRSTDAGDSWTRILGIEDELAFVVRANGDLVAGTPFSGSFVSRAPSNGDAWTPIASPPRIRCLTENSAGEVWACTANFGGEQFPGDNAGIMKTTDLVTWTPVLRFQDIPTPRSCPSGTLQKDACEPMWCSLKRQLGITSTAIGCPEVFFDGPPDASNPLTDSASQGCCDTGGSELPYAGFGLGLIVLITLRRSRATPPRT